MPGIPHFLEGAAVTGLPYTPAMQAGQLLFVSGQLPLVPGTNQPPDDTIESQTEQTLQNLRRLLQAAGTDLSHVIKTTVFLADISLFSRMNTIYSRFFPTNPPARSAFAVAALPFGVLVEIEAIAMIPTQNEKEITDAC